VCRVSPLNGSEPAPDEHGQQVLGPLPGSYDAEWVARTARTADPGLPEETARELAVYAGEHLREVKALDAPEVARRLLADHPQAGATAASVVAKAAVDFCRAYDIQP
jgi:hypothetical protein